MVIFAPVALITGPFFTFKVKYCRVPSRLGFHRSDVRPPVVQFAEYLLAPGILLWAYGDGLSGGSVAYGAVVGGLAS